MQGINVYKQWCLFHRATGRRTIILCSFCVFFFPCVLCTCTQIQECIVLVTNFQIYIFAATRGLHPLHTNVKLVLKFEL